MRKLSSDKPEDRAAAQKALLNHPEARTLLEEIADGGTVASDLAARTLHLIDIGVRPETPANITELLVRYRLKEKPEYLNDRRFTMLGEIQKELFAAARRISSTRISLIKRWRCTTASSNTTPVNLARKITLPSRSHRGGGGRTLFGEEAQGDVGRVHVYLEAFATMVKIRLAMADAHAALGSRAKALHDLEICRKIAPNNPEIAQKLRKLQDQTP